MTLRPSSSLVRLAAIAAFGMLIGCAKERADSGAPDDGHGGQHEEDTRRGPNGGWLFEDNGIQFELDIEEATGPPEFVGRMYDTAGKSLSVSASTLSVALERFGGRRESIDFITEGDHFRSASEIREPHSFDVAITLQRDGRTHRWSHEQIEFRVTLTADAVRAAGIEIGQASARTIAVQVNAPGEVHLNGERVLQVRPRFPGIVKSFDKRLGDIVAPDDLLGVIQSDESLSEYEIRAAMAGTIVARTAAPGASVGREDILFTIADLSTVWIDFAIYPQHIGLVRRGQTVHLRSRSGPELTASGIVSYVGPLLEQDTRVSYGRVVVRNGDGRWQPGVYVTASITVDAAQVPVGVPESAIVRSKFGPAVFRALDATFEVQPIQTGRSDGLFTEVLTGLEPGAPVVTQNAFLLKAELGKSEARHEH